MLRPYRLVTRPGFGEPRSSCGIAADFLLKWQKAPKGLAISLMIAQAAAGDFLAASLLALAASVHFFEAALRAAANSGSLT